MKIQEKPLRYGEGGRGLAVITLPDVTEGAPVVVMLNAGLLHRTEPYRLNVLAARRLAALGYVCVRVDISGKGDTPLREGLINRESVALDWRHLREALDRQFGPRTLLVMGLCSGADNGIKLAAQDKAIRGLILLDAESPRDAGFSQRQLLNKLLNRHAWTRLPRSLLRRLRPAQTSGVQKPLDLRDRPRPDDLEACVKNLVGGHGRVLALFTSHATTNYNQEGQFARAVGNREFATLCTEHFWPDAQHLYPVQAHRKRLLAAIETWAALHLEHLRSHEAPP